MKHRCLHAFVVLLVGLQTGISGEAKKSDDAKNIQGTWKIVSFEMPSAPDTVAERNEMMKTVRVKFTATERFTLVGKKEEDRVQYRLYADRPGVLDQFADTNVGTDEVPAKLQQWWPAIYQLEGDVLKICSADSDANGATAGKVDLQRIEGARPRTFRADKRTLLMVLKRDK